MDDPLTQLRLGCCATKPAYPSLDGRGECPLPICGRPKRRKQFFGGNARSRMLPSVRPLMQHRRLRARMGVRGPEPHHPRRAHGTVESPGSSGPVSPTVVPYSPSTDYAFRRPLVRLGLRRGCDRSSVILFLHKHGPDDPRCLVGKGNRDQHMRFPRHHLL